MNKDFHETALLHHVVALREAILSAEADGVKVNHTGSLGSFLTKPTITNSPFFLVDAEPLSA